ncbi:HinfI family type II restriction enzyme [[Mycoplasma] falconis]|uniref:HinfI family type II restriction enzyme n=1 Tax=[Mycoplasma] falconis TaxID=92403 RepID=UPI001B885854|nr:restriction endonuclease [[Mycoplasma] falconis]
MNNNLKKLIYQSVVEMIDKCQQDKILEKLKNKHLQKIHFIPSKIRTFGGILQSLNIQFGNFIQTLLKNLIKSNVNYEILEKYSGKTSLFGIPLQTELIIDEYITNSQINKNLDLNSTFRDLQNKIIYQANNIINKQIKIKHDIDLMFKDKITNQIYLLEIKYNDDHDTGKFIDINRKLIKTYAYIVNELNIEDINTLTPILFFFNDSKKSPNIFLPEGINILRGKEFLINS